MRIVPTLLVAMTTALPLDTRPGKEPRPEEIERLQRFLRRELDRVGIRVAGPAPEVPFEIQGSVIEFKRGSGLVRFFVGGLGAARVTANLRLVERETGRVLFAGNFTGIVDGWTLGEEASRRLAATFAYALRSGWD